MFPRIALYTGALFCVLIFAQASASAQCQPTVDCNQNGVADQCDIDLGTSDDCNGNLIPDECDLELATSEDCNLDGIPDECSPGTADLVGIGLAFGGGFGSAVDSTADFAVVGAPDDDLLGTNTGSANIFKRTGTRWAEEMKIFGVAATLEDRFGAAVAIESDLAAIGAPGKLQGRGAVFLYRRVGNGWWNYEGTLTAFDAPLGAAFGSAIAIENETIFVGAPGTLNGLGSGSVYVFTHESGMWLQDQKLESDQLTDGDMLGCSIAVHGGTVAIGAPGHESGGVTNSGSVLIFEESAGIYTESLMLSAETPSPFATFGYSLDVNHDHLLVGAPGENVDSGAAYLHNRLASMWINQQKIEPEDIDESGLFGADVGLDVKTAVISAPAAGSDQGQVVIYRKSGLDWIKEAPLSPVSDRIAGDFYGSSLSCQLPFLIVGSSGDSSGKSIWISVYNDCNENLEDDICDVTQGIEADCNMNLIPDACEIADGTKQDCDGNGVPDECQISSGELLDCNMNGVPDGCDVTSGFSLDCNQDQIPDECQVDADPLLPTISNMPNPFNVSTDLNECGAVVTWDEPIATDNCGIASLETTHPSGSFFSTGLTIVTYTATDVSGNTRAAMFTVVVTDDELPTLTGFQNVVSVDSSEGICELAVNWPAPSPVDNCGIFSMTSTHQPGDIFPVGTTTVTYTLTDTNGNVSAINLDVVVVDTVAPEISGMPADIDLLTEPGICTRLVEWVEPEASDDCNVASFTSNIASGTVFELGTTTVTYTVIDGWGNVVSSSFNVTIRDEELPVFAAAPADIVSGNDPGECHAQISWAPATVQDNCGVNSVVSSHQPGDIFPLGDTEVTITATDDNGNVNLHQFTVSILDTEAPLISNIPEDFVLNNDPAQCSAVVNWQLPGISDNCGISVFSGTANSGDAFPIGTTVVEYTLVDNSGNQTNANFSITVTDTEMPILLGLPQDISVFNDPGQCGANVTWEVPTPWDNCELVDFDGSHEPGAFFPKGTTEVTYLVMDGMGQVTTGSFDVSVDDDEAPQISGMPADRTISADAGLCSAIHSWTVPVPSDNCEVVSFIATHEPGEAFPVGVTQVSYTVIDSMGMTTTDQFSITVVDNENPQIIRIPSDMTVVVEEGDCTIPVSWIAPDSQDNCAIDTFSLSHASGSEFPVGLTTVEINTADIHGNTSAASFTVTVLDQETPVILNLPADISLTSDGDACGTTVTWIEPQGADNCSVSDLSSDQVNGEFYPVGITVVTYSILDASGNSDEASFAIEITDTTAPAFVEIPQGIQMSTDPGQCGAIVSWNPVTADDNCEVDTISGSHSSGMFFNTGITTVDYLVTDIHGNQTSHSFDVEILDQEQPQIIGIDENIVMTNDGGQCGANVSWVQPEATDNCLVDSLTHSIPSGAFFSVGTTQVSYLAVDNSGNETVKSFSVTVEDNEKPAFVAIPELVSGTTTEGTCDGIVNWDEVTGSDNCLVDSITLTHASGDVFPLGDTTVTATITDIHGNMHTSDFTVRIEDDELPQLLGTPTDQFKINDPGECGAIVDWIIPGTSDNCQVQILEGTHVPGSFFERGTTVVSYTVTDASGNSYMESFEVNIVDLETPEILGTPADIVAVADTGSCGTNISWIEPTSTDNCSVQALISSHNPGDFFITGTTVVSYTSQDPTGNITTTQFNVTILDEEFPTFGTFPESVTVSNDADQCGASVSWIEPQMLDNCSIGSSGSDHQSGDFFPIGTTVVTYEIADPSGNTISDSFSITVEDTQAPDFLTFVSSTVLENDPGECGAVHTWGVPEVFENCPELEVVSSHNPGDFFNTGLTVVSYTATDGAGLVSQLMFTVIVLDTENPQIAGMPADITQATDLDSCGAIVDWAAPQASDNCDVLSFTSDHAPGDFFPKGTTTVTYSVLDTAGLLVTESFNVTILDQQLPSITAMPQSVTINSQNGLCGSMHAWDLPQSSDNCPDHVFSGSHQPGDFFEVGSTTVAYTAIDSSGNVSSADFVVTVVDNENPEIVGAPQDMVIIADEGVCSMLVMWDAPTFEDNCGIDTFAISRESGSEFLLGDTLVEITTTDIHGNSSAASFTVTILDQELPQVVDLPADMSVENDLDSCGAVVSWIEPTSSDNCEVTSLTGNQINGGTYPIGITVVEYTVVDSSGNTNLASFQIEVLDTQLPELFAMPADITQATDLDSCGAIVDWAAPQASDNCDVLGFTSDHAPGDFFPKGTTTVTYSVLDTAGLLVTESFNVTILDQQLPSITAMPQSVTINSQNGLCGSMHAWDLPQSSDNCPDHVFSGSHQPGDFFEVGSTTVAYTAIDSSGNVSSADFVVTVVDNENPEIVGAPQDMVIIADEGVCSMLVMWDAPTFEDNCGIDTFAISRESGSEFLLGDTLVEITTTDIHGNSSAASFTVTILDQELPQVVDLPADMSVENDLDSCGAVVSWIEPTSSDNCEVTSLTGNQINGGTYPIGITVVEYTVVDSSGNTNLASFQIEVLDTQLPELFAMPDSVLQVNDAGACGAVIGWDLPQTSDNCPDQILTSTHNPGDFFSVGETTVSYTVTDASGNTRSLSFDIQIVDLEIPVVVDGPQDILVEAEQGLCGSTISWIEPTAIDNCEVFDLKPSNYPGEFFAVGTTLVSYTAIDTTGNIAVHEFNVTVEDTQAPIIDGLTGDISVNTDFNQCDAIVTWTEPTISDNCTVVSVNVDISSGTAFPIGTTTVTYTVIDSAGLETVQSFDVTVSDNQIPTFENIPGNVVLSVEPGTCQSLHHWIEPTITDNCPGLTVTASHQPGDSFPVGLTIVSYQAADAHGQSRQIMFTVVVQDDENPVLAGIPEDVILENDLDQCGAVHQWVEPTASDNCATVGFNTTHPSGSFFDLGTTEVVYSVSDPSGNMVSASFNVTVVDLQLPEFVTVPETVSLNTDPGVCGAAHYWDVPNVYDNCEEINLASSHQPGHVFPIGTTVVTYTAQDPTGNVVSTDFSVTVSDFEDPDFEGIPGTITVNTEPGLCDAAVDWVAPIAVDNCEVQSHSSSHQPGDRFELGQTSVILSATDIYGNDFTTSFLVIVEDHELPVISGMPESVTIPSIQGFCGASHLWDSPTASDNCDTLAPTADYLSGHFFPVGSTTVTYSVTDESGNSTEDSFIVTVEDVEAPVFTAISTDYTVSADADQCGTAVIWPDAEASDNCGVDSITYDRTNGLFLELGDHPVNVTVTDIHGLQTTQQFVITVVDDTAPVIHDLPADIQLTATEGQCGAVATWIEPTSTDNCPGRLLANNIPSGSFFLVGQTTVSYVSTDASGNTTTESFTVTVEDDQLPTLAGIPDDIVVSNDQGICGAQVSWTPPAALDNCGIETHVSSYNPGDLFNLGTTTVEIVATDYSGNSVTGTFLVTVEDTEAPGIANLPENMTVESEVGMCGANVSWVEPFTVDNCATGTLVSDIANGAYLNVGLHQVTYTATDLHGNVTTDSFSIEVVDAETPIILSAPSSVEIQVQDGLCGSIYSWFEIQATDNCAIDSITNSHESGSFFPKGTTLVQQTVSDAAGNSVSHEFEVTVVDHEAPQFSSSISGLSLQSVSGACGTSASWTEPEISDNCEIASLTKSHEPGDFFEVGETLVTYTLVDGSGNETSIDFLVSVEDVEAPVISGLQSSVSVSTDPGFCGATVYWDAPVITDNCLVDNILSTHQPGDFFPVGNTVVTYSVSDNSELVTTVEFLITVTDNETPQINNIPSIDLIETEPGLCGAVVAWSSPSVTDNCQVTSLTSDIQNGTFLEIGQHTIVFTALDIHGNESTAGFTVTIIDGEAPTITDLPTVVEGVTTSDSCMGSVNWAEPLISDNCGEFALETSHQSGDSFNLGITTVTYTATDLQGNTQSASFEVHIADVHGPEISGLPLEISSDTDPDSCLAIVDWAEASVLDHCGDFNLEKTHEPGTAFPVGTTEVVYTATDLAGNVTQVSFPVTVTDVQAPLITLIPEDQTILANEDECTMIANWPAPTATDNCGVASIVTSHNSGDLYPVGVNTVEILVTDVHGNTTTASFQINVIDSIDPILTGVPADITTVSDPTICGAEITWVEPNVIENCALLKLESDYAPGTIFPVGLTVVNYVAVDLSGNSTSASFTVTVIDDEAPTIEIPVPVIVDAPEGSCEVFVEVPLLEVYDRCGVSQITNSFNGTADASGIYPRGETLILWSVSDESGNISTITGVVSVQVSGPDCNANGVPDVCDIAEDISTDCNQDGIPDECQADCDDDGILDVCEITQGLVLDCDLDGVPDDCQIASGIAADCDGDGLIDSCEILTGSGLDCDNSGVLDSCEIAQGTVADCNNNGQPDLCDIALGVESDCNNDGIADACQIASGSEVDCNADGVIDTCELANGSASDCNGNGTLDVCDLATGNADDCNQNSIPDSCDIASGIAFDCNANGQLDICDIEQGLADDCDTNNVPDACDVASGATPDCNSNGIPDSCDLSSGASEDCNGTGIPDSCEVASGATPDCNGNGVPDSCDLANGTADCDNNNVPDSCQIASGESPDCNGNGVPDACDISSGAALDCNTNGVPDSCEVANGQAADCNSNGIPDSCDIASGVESDCNSSGVPDSCEVTSGTALDCNDNGIPDSCDIASGNWQDCDADGNLDSCEILVGTEQDCNGTGIPDACEILSGAADDCDGNQIPDSCDLVTGVLSDCDQNGTPDTCDILAGGVEDCDGNQVPDSCDLLTGTLEDCNQNAVPDSCEIAAGDTEDCDGNGIPDSCDIAAGLLLDANLDGIPDQCQLNFLRGDGNDDGIVNIADGIFLLQSLFADGADSTCNDAADANDDSSIDVSDVISILGYQFNGTNPPPAPYPNCGVDPAGGVSLGCEAYTSCP
ncbi:MAG: HYR domain-containing protein [Planctomycetota bacterium]